MKQIGIDFQGWPIQAHTLREILLNLGFNEIESGLFKIDNPDLLDSYPLILEDDGMGYGVRDSFVIELSSDIYKDKSLDSNVFNYFIYPKITV